MQTFPKMATEFPDFDQTTLPTIPVGFEDESWHNDSCPNFIHQPTGMNLWIDFADPEIREFPEAKRFTLRQMDAATDYGWQSGDTVIAEGDDWPTIFGAIRREAAKAPGFDGKGLLYEVEVPAEVKVTPTTLEEAKRWIDCMIAADLDIHLDDSAASIEGPHGTLFRAEDCDAIDAARLATFAFDWGVYEDPHGYNIAACKEAGLQDFWTKGDLIEFGGGQEALVVEVDPTNRKRAIIKVTSNGAFMPVETTMEDSAWGNFIDLHEEGDLFTVEEARAVLSGAPGTMTLDPDEVKIVKTLFDTMIGDSEEAATLAGACDLPLNKVEDLIKKLDAWPTAADQMDMGF